MRGQRSEMLNTMYVRLKELREAKGLTPYKMAQLLGMHETTCYLYEHGARIPNAETLVSICKLLNCSADYLLGLQLGPDSEVIRLDGFTTEHKNLLNELAAFLSVKEDPRSMRRLDK